MLTDEFSFPKVTANTFNHQLLISPSAWHVSSLVYPACNPDEDRGVGEGFSRKSFSYFESEIKTEVDGTERRESEEKMDMLWEEFNEELQRVSSMDKRKQAEKLSRSIGSESQYEGGATEEIELCCLQALKTSKTSKRPNTVVGIKVLKKLCLLRKLRSRRNPS
ncbi:hypothetical protein CJ030_MR5G008789 [Morella rubra]|uniref:Uncharacterized protein n=1 Tax=Morella rubra TaxID=262757 RepID=A0A6A1WSD6_9ROSI|nr:hypothetical protein CJ030_MR5G008789 [Morella rubra]